MASICSRDSASLLPVRVRLICELLVLRSKSAEKAKSVRPKSVSSITSIPSGCSKSVIEVKTDEIETGVEQCVPATGVDLDLGHRIVAIWQHLTLGRKRFFDQINPTAALKLIRNGRVLRYKPSTRSASIASGRPCETTPVSTSGCPPSTLIKRRCAASSTLLIGTPAVIRNPPQTIGKFTRYRQSNRCVSGAVFCCTRPAWQTQQTAATQLLVPVLLAFL